MRNILFCIFFLITSTAIAQTDAIIELRGTGETKITPDQGYLNIEIVAKNKDMSTTITDLNKKTDALYKQLAKLGFKTSEVETTGFNVYKNIVYIKGEPRDSGYIGRQNFIVEFPNKKERIAEIINSFSNNSTNAQFSFSFGLSDDKMKEVRNELIKKAIQDAREKATLIAEASGKQLGEIVEIQYGFPEPGHQPVYKGMAMREMQSNQDQGASQGFEVREIDLSDTITIKYKLK